MNRDLVAGFIFRESPNQPGAAEYLALHRSPTRGNFWQSVTGGIEATDTSPADAIYREVGEELDLMPQEVIDTGYSFPFQGKRGATGTAHVFGIRVDTFARPALLDEHDARLWVPYPGMRQLISNTWAENTEGLNRVHSWVRNDSVHKALPYTPRRAFDEHNYSVVVMTPTAAELGIEDEAAAGFRRCGLETAASIKALQLGTIGLKGMWQDAAEHPDRYRQAIDLITRGRVSVQLLEGPQASEHVQAVKNELHARYGIERGCDPQVMGADHQEGEPLLYSSSNMVELASRAIAFFGPTLLNHIVETRLYPAPVSANTPNDIAAIL
ncbi:MAG TPA: NUDIX domain-containing protein [Bacillota bacterium]|nr:NUDIX domain-containing protein [Bacillota bacterium]